MLQKFERKIRKLIKIKGRVHIDEVYVLAEGRKIVYINCRDSKTKFNLFGLPALQKSYENAKKVLKALKHEFANRPKHLVSDRAEYFRRAFIKYFYRIAKLTFGVPIACKKYGLKHNNNCIERHNGYVKDLCRGKRKLKNFASAFDFLELHRICLNFLHPLESLNDKTPAEVAGLTLGISTFAELISVAEKFIY
ncbi:MAG: DDE-type integrase/transposase/recombinase [Elusimicrobiota bacterium]|nr:DDE-type integrase/transposase/recombinase [Elusimicrobiota bacterium]